MQTDTVADPGAMMVHSEYTLPADVAVMGPGRLHLVALLAILEAIGPLNSEWLSTLDLFLVDDNTHQRFCRSLSSSLSATAPFHLVQFTGVGQKER